MKYYTSRLEAAQNGKNVYLGSLCRHGHKGIRWVLTGACCDCSKHYAARRKAVLKKILNDNQ